MFILGACVSKGFAQSTTYTLDHNIFHVSTDSTVTATFEATYGGNAMLLIYNSAGEVVKTLFNGSLPANTLKTVTWDGKNSGGANVASGIYFFWLKLELGAQTKNLMVVR